MSENNYVKDPNEIKIGLWTNKSKSGVEYLAGKFEGKRFAIFPNTRKKQPKSPDFTMIVTIDPNYRGEYMEQERPLAPSPEERVNSYAPQQPLQSEPDSNFFDSNDDDGIPF